MTQSGQRQKKCEFYTPVLIELTVETETPRHAAATLSGVQAMAVLDRSSKSTSHTSTNPVRGWKPQSPVSHWPRVKLVVVVVVVVAVVVVWL